MHPEARTAQGTRPRRAWSVRLPDFEKPSERLVHTLVGCEPGHPSAVPADARLAKAVLDEMAVQALSAPRLATLAKLPRSTVYDLLSGRQAISCTQSVALAAGLGMGWAELVARAEAGLSQGPQPVHSATTLGQTMRLRGAFVHVVRRTLRRTHTSVAALARESGIPRRTLTEIMGHRQTVNLDQAEDISEALGMKTSELVAEAEGLGDCRKLSVTAGGTR